MLEPVPDLSTYRIRPMTLDDVAPVFKLNRIVNPDPWSEQMLKEEVLRSTSNRSRPIVLWDQVHICGYCVTWSVVDELDIHMIAVDPAYRRRGLGAYLLSETLVHAANQQLTRVHLEVRASNSAAIHLYQSFHFVEVGRRPDYYKRPSREDAILMSIDLTQSEAISNLDAQIKRSKSRIITASNSSSSHHSFIP